MRSSVNSMVVLVLMVLVIGSPLYADDFHEGWEKAKIGMYIPTDHDYFILKADEGYWDVGDTIGTFPVPECQPTPQNAEIVTYNGSNALRLESVLTDCADNVWVALFESEPAKYNKGFSISLRPDTFISFEEVGNLDNPEIHGWTIDGCGLPPCYDNVSIILTDNRTSGRDLSDLGYTEEDLPNLTYSELMEILEYLEGGTQTSVLAYVLQRYPEAAPNTTHSNYREIFLDPNTGFYVRNLYDDFMTIPDFDPAGAKITSIEIQVDEHGWAIFDNIYIGNDAPEEPSQNDPGDVDRELDLACSIGKVKMPVSMLAGEEVAGKIQVIVTNQSAWPTADNQYMDLVIAMRAEDGSVDIVQETLEDQFIGGLKPYKSKKFNVNVNLDLPEGYYTLVATVVPVADSGMVTAIDAVDDVVRSVLPSQRDLIVEFSRLKLPSSVVAGESTKIKIPLVVTNNGNIPIAGGTTIDILIKARPVGIMDSSGDVILAEITDLSVSGLKPGKGKKCKATVTFPGDFPEDDYTLIVLLDSSDDVDESDESNNMGTSDGIFHVLAAMTDCCSDELSLVGTWAVSAIQGAPGKVNAANSTWTFYENGTYAWFLYYQGYYDLDEYGSYTLSEDILTVNSDSIMAVILGSESTPITLKKDNFTFRDEDNDKWTYVKME